MIEAITLGIVSLMLVLTTCGMAVAMKQRDDAIDAKRHANELRQVAESKLAKAQAEASSAGAAASAEYSKLRREIEGVLRCH